MGSMPLCSNCQSELSEIPNDGLCPRCGKTVELGDPNQTIDLPTANAPAADNPIVDIDATIDLPLDVTVEQEPTDLANSIEPTSSDDPTSTVDFTESGTLRNGDIGSGTVDFDVSSTVDYGVTVSGDEAIDNDATIDLPVGKTPTEPNLSDMTVDLSNAPFDAESQDMQLAWGDQAGKTIRQDQTIEIGKTVSGFRSSLPIKSRSLRPPEYRGVADDPNEKQFDGQAPDYELLSLLGQGGMGVVYSAKQSSIARTVAVKMLKTGDSKSSDSGTQGSLDQRDKFISEAVITGELEHPNIVPIYDLGANDEGALFYSMKRVKGTPWDEVIGEKSLSQNLDILMRVADAVAFAHASGVVHRDLKPENVMLGGYGEVLVMDWGLARVTSDFPSADSVYQADSLGGTPAYMSPEMSKGPIEAIDHRSDVYLLGAMLYEVIGGKPPHTGKNVMACLMAASKNIIVPIEYEGELLSIALRALETKPADRYQSVKAFQEAVNTYLAHAESILLATNAEKSLEQARESKDYELYSRALYGFEEAISLWDGNKQAYRLLTQSRIEYSRTAFDKGDFDLAATLLEADDLGLEVELLREQAVESEVVELRQQIFKAQAERDTRSRRVRDLKYLAFGLIALMIGLGTYSYIEISRQKDVAVKQRDIADKQRIIAREKEAEAKEQREVAEVNEAAAIEARKEEEVQRIEAVKQRRKADDNAELAKANEQLANENAEAARLARDDAQAAEVNEAYAAYTARIGLAAEKIEENAFGEALALLEACPKDFRQWEWGRLRYLCELSEQVDDLGAPVDQVVYSPSGKLYASGDWFGNVTLRQTSDSTVIWKKKLAQYVHSVAFAPNGQQLAAAASDGVVYQLDTSSGAVMKQLVGHKDAVLTVAYSSDGKQIASGGYDETVRLWDAASGDTLQELKGHTWWVWAVRFSPNGQLLVSVGQDGRAVVWQRNADRFDRQAEFTGHEGPVYDAAFSPDSQQVATAGFDQTICLWNPNEIAEVDLARRLDGLDEEETKYQQLRGHTGPVRSLDFSSDGKRLLSGSQDNTLRLWELGHIGVGLGSAQQVMSKPLRGHGGRVFSVMFSPDDKAALSAGHDHQIRHWVLGSYREQIPLHTTPLAGHHDAVLSAHFSADGQQVVTASRDRTAKLWDIASAKSKMTFSEGHDFLASSAVLTADGRTLVTSAGDNTVRIWDVATATEKHLLSETGRSAAMTVDPAGKWVATGGPKGTIRWWNLRTGELQKESHEAEEAVTAIAVSTDGSLLAAGDQRGVISVWKQTATDWELSYQLKGHSRSITGLRFNEDASRLVSASGDWTCGQWDLTQRKELRSLVLKHPDWVGSLDLSEDGRFAITACDDGHVRLWSLDDAKVVVETELPDVMVNTVDLSVDGREALLTSSGNRTVSRWNLSSNSQPVVLIDGKQGAGLIWSARYGTDQKSLLTVGGNDAQLWRLDPLRPTLSFSPHGAVADAKLSPNGKVLATGSWDHSAKLWDPVSGKSLRKLEGAHQGFINAVDFTPNGEELLTASDDRTVRFWKVATGELFPVALQGHDGRVMQAVYGPQGTTVLTASADKTARLWDRATGQPMQSFIGHEWAVLCCAISQDGKIAVTGSADNKAKIWDAQTGELLHTLSGHTASVSSVAISPDGRRILTGGQDNVAKLWDVEKGQELLTLSGHAEEVTSVSFSPDGRSALTASRDAKAIVWPVAEWTTTD